MNTKLKGAFVASIILNVLLIGIFFGTLSRASVVRIRDERG